ncbi:MAG: ATP-binding protein [Nocardioidaceae bacterium]
MTRGALRIYLGAAPGIGKTYAVLAEAHRRKARGADVVIGFVETHGRAGTSAMIGDLEVVDRRRLSYRDQIIEEMDVDALIARRPGVVCVDELAHTNAAGSKHTKRWRDVEDLLDAGITVLSTVNLQQLESMNDVGEKITGIRQQETVPDSIVRRAEQIELVDFTPEALRRRMAHGNIYPAKNIDATVSNYFRVVNLTALRELALVWLADRVNDSLQGYRRGDDIDETWEVRECVVVALSGGSEGGALIRRARRIAARGGADLLGVHIARSDDLAAGSSPAYLAEQRRLIETLGGSYHEVVGDNVPHALLEFARAANATQLVLGASRRSAVARLLAGPGIGASTVRRSGNIDIHMVSHEQAAGDSRLPRLGVGLGPRRRLYGGIVAAVSLPILTLALVHLRTVLNITSDSLAFLVIVLAVSLIGGAYPGIITAVVASLLLNYFFSPPLHRWTIAQHDNVIALVAFLLVAVAASWVVELAARRTAQAARASAEAKTLATLAGSVLRGEAALTALVQRLREALSLSTVTLLERERSASGWTPIAWAGDKPSIAPDDGDANAMSGDDLALVVCGRLPMAEDQRLLAVFAVQARVALEQQRLADAAAAAKPIAEADRMRTALLAAVSHDLRTPLASAAAAVQSLDNGSIAWTPQQTAELVTTARESLERLGGLVENLLDMSRLQAGALAVFPEPTALDEAIPLALDTFGEATGKVEIDIPTNLPDLQADPALLERVIANLIANALRYAPPDQPPRVAASVLGEQVELRVIDHGPGVPTQDWDQIFTPFQRLGDTDNTTGVGLGLALARGLAEAMGGHLFPEETPGGGLTMVLQLSAAQTTRVALDVSEESHR